MDWSIYIPFVLIALIVLVQVRAYWGSKRMKGKSIPALSELLDLPGAQQQRLLVYFYSDHCPQCPPVSALIDKLSGEYSTIVKIDALTHLEVAERFGIRATPAVVIVDQGQVEEVVIGTVSESRLRDLLEQGG